MASFQQMHSKQIVKKLQTWQPIHKKYCGHLCHKSYDLLQMLGPYKSDSINRNE